MALTKEQAERRRKYVGGSDIAAIMGVDPWRSPEDVWCEKVHGVEDFSSDAATLGDHLESACKSLAEEYLGIKLTSANAFRRVPDTPIGVLLDAWYQKPDDGMVVPVECKTSGLLNPWGEAMQEWGDGGGDDVPPRYILQVHGQMMATGASYSHISALLPGRGHVMYRVERDEELTAVILEHVASFWHMVEIKSPPPAAPSLDILKRLRRLPEAVVDLGGSVADKVIAWQALAAEKRDAESRYEAAQAEVIAALGVAEAAVIGWSDDKAGVLAEVMGLEPDAASKKELVSYMKQTRSSADAKKLRQLYPEVWEAVKVESSFRVLRLAKMKKGVVPNMTPGGEVVEGGES